MAAHRNHLPACCLYPLRVAASMLLLAALLLAGCRPLASPQGTAPPVSTPAPQPAPPAADRLPTTLMKEWQPLSKVLVAFGPMTITAQQIQWGSGQTSSYSLVSLEGGYLLKLDDSPAFYDSPTQYIKLIPRPESPAASASVEVAFYTDETQIKDDEYVMYGSYFAE